MMAVCTLLKPGSWWTRAGRRAEGGVRTKERERKLKSRI